jgi:phosphopantetheinyl transferase
VRYLGIASEAVALLAGNRDKPFLDPAAHKRVMDFIVSDSGDLALIAVSAGAS